jgi:hypothetical protein
VDGSSLYGIIAQKYQDHLGPESDFMAEFGSKMQFENLTKLKYVLLSEKVLEVMNSLPKFKLSNHEKSTLHTAITAFVKKMSGVSTARIVQSPRVGSYDYNLYREVVQSNRLDWHVIYAVYPNNSDRCVFDRARKAGFFDIKNAFNSELHVAPLSPFMAAAMSCVNESDKDNILKDKSACLGFSYAVVKAAEAGPEVLREFASNIGCLAQMCSLANDSFVFEIQHCLQAFTALLPMAQALEPVFASGLMPDQRPLSEQTLAARMNDHDHDAAALDLDIDPDQAAHQDAGLEPRFSDVALQELVDMFLMDADAPPPMT